MSQIQPPPPDRPWWVTFLKFIAVALGVVFVVAIVLVGFIFFTCTRR